MCVLSAATYPERTRALEVERAAGDKPRGIAVHVGARIMSSAGTGDVLVSSTTRDLVAGSGLEFEDRGERELKGIEGVRRLYAARSWIYARVVMAIRSARFTSWIAARIAVTRSSSASSPPSRQISPAVVSSS
jgi:hypothetical protein